jgi:hypothetical protein
VRVRDNQAGMYVVLFRGAVRLSVVLERASQVLRFSVRAPFVAPRLAISTDAPALIGRRSQ